VTLSANIFGTVVGDGFEQIKELPGMNDIDPTLDGRQERNTKADCIIYLATPQSKTPLGRILLT
jgi:hypothetical protein